MDNGLQLIEELILQLKKQLRDIHRIQDLTEDQQRQLLEDYQNWYDNWRAAVVEHKKMGP